MNLDAMKKDKMKQRSFYMDDETYALIEAHATKLGTSNGTVLRMLVRHELLDAPAEPVSQRAVPYQQALTEPTEVVVHGLSPELTAAQRVEASRTERRETAIVLPPDKQETFKVPDRFKEKGPRAPKAVHSDDDF